MSLRIMLFAIGSCLAARDFNCSLLKQSVSPMREKIACGMGVDEIYTISSFYSGTRIFHSSTTTPKMYRAYSAREKQFPFAVAIYKKLPWEKRPRYICTHLSFAKDNCCRARRVHWHTNQRAMGAHRCTLLSQSRT